MNYEYPQEQPAGGVVGGGGFFGKIKISVDVFLFGPNFSFSFPYPFVKHIEVVLSFVICLSFGGE